jgi:uncharacterized membrane protein YdbT with pleckstrin-like domain
MEDRIKMMLPLLDEKQRRLFLAIEALAYGYGGIARVRRISGASKNTIKRGIREHKAGAAAMQVGVIKSTALVELLILIGTIISIIIAKYTHGKLSEKINIKNAGKRHFA